MKNVLTAGAALLLTTSVASAGGLDRSGQPVGIIFEDGNVLQLSFGSINPTVVGETVAIPMAVPAGISSGDVGESYFQFGAGVKVSYGNSFDVALIYDQPFGAAVSYEDADAGYYTNTATSSLTATVDTSALTALARYKINDNISVYGGLRYQTVEANVVVPIVAEYEITTDPSSAWGYVVGAAYEIPEIALRVALTYNSKISHDITGTETCGSPVCTGSPEVTEVDTPESFNLDFQSGIAEDTLLFGSIRYARWTQFDFRPNGYASATGGGDPAAGASLQQYDDDTVSYSLGVGRRFNDVYSGAVTVGYEAAQGGFSGPLGPTDGNFSVGLGGTYAQDTYEVTVGARYIMIGDAETEGPGPLAGNTIAEFNDNSAIAFGVQFTQKF